MARGGARAGAGKRKGQWDRATLEAELIAAKQQLAQHEARQSKGQKLAVEVLNDVMHVCYGLMAKHQPAAPGEVLAIGREPSQEKFVDYMRLTMDAAKELAPFQSSKFKSVTHSIEQPPGGAATVPENPGAVLAMSPQEAYRMLRDSSQLIDLVPNVVKLPAPKPKKQARS